MKTKLYAIILVTISTICFQACLDYDVPSDEFNQNEVKVDDVIYQGAADSIDYLKSITLEGLNNAYTALSTPLRQAKGGQYALRGGKEGGYPGAHAYQRQFTLGPDNYAQFSVVPHSDFMYGTLNHTYDVSEKFNPGPYSSFEIAKNAIIPLLNRPEVDSIPELKAVYLLLFNFAAQEVTDLYGPFPYVDFKNNKVEAPFTYNDLRTIYTNIEANVDTVLNCLHHFDERPEWYQQRIKSIFSKEFRDLSDSQAANVNTWIRFANSFKLRMAMHIVKVDDVMAKKWAEEAVADGVIESIQDELSLKPFSSGFSHPLMDISGTWNDTRISASFESLLMSLNHPYASYLFTKNSDAIINKKTNETLLAETRFVGIRSGIEPGLGQSFSTNQLVGFSAINIDIFGSTGVPLYLMKLSEVDFLRAEGALRNWNMNGTASSFYERGIDYAYLEDRNAIAYSTDYIDALPAYKNKETATDYTYVDPSGVSENMPSVTKIGVKWNEGDSPEVKLEKIITQKYIAAYPYSFEPWVDLRRTGYPKVFPVLNPQNGDGSLQYGDIIHRMPFPNKDDSSIKDIQETGLEALGGPDQQATRLWWDVDKANF